jgi:hypothetical protein
MKAIKKWVVAHKESGLKLGLLLILALAVWSNPLNRVPEVCKMPLEFSGTNQHLVFADVAHLDDLEIKLITGWINFDTYGEANFGTIINKVNPAGEGWSVQLDNGNYAANTLIFVQDPVGGSNIGVWRIPANSLATGNLYAFAIYMDISNINNTPLMYLDGVSQTVTETANPSGSFASAETGEPIYIGDTRFDNRAFDGRIYDLRIYDLTGLGLITAQIDQMVASIYAARGADGPGDAVFWCPGLGAEGVSAPDTALGSTNYVYDQIKGIAGTPSGSPILRADRYLSYP